LAIASTSNRATAGLSTVFARHARLRVSGIVTVRLLVLPGHA
jgi:hypothetical protein